MTQALIRARYFDAPPVVPLVGTILDAATVVQVGSFLETADIHESYNCLVTDSFGTFPCPDEERGTSPKSFNEIVWIDGIRFVVYAGLTCKAISFDRASGQTKLRNTYLANEHRGIEQALMAGAFPGATDITPAGGAVKPEVGTALLEEHAADLYAGVPTIHASRAIGGILFARAAAERSGNEFFTRQGSKLVSGAGYGGAYNADPDGAPPAAGTSWVYATGEVVVGMGEIIEANELAVSDNTVRVLVERPYVVTTDCYLAAVQVSVS